MTAAILVLDEYAPTGRGPARSPWVARLLGPDPKRNYERSFVEPSRDYHAADKRGRGVKACFRIDAGNIYEVCRWKTRDKSERYFVTVNSIGEVVGVAHDDVDRILADAQRVRDEAIRALLAQLVPSRTGPDLSGLGL
jgi:hypothetical protein